VSCEVEYTDEFDAWWGELVEDEQESVAFVVRLLEARGVLLDYPYCSEIKKSKHGQLRELRIQHICEPYRVFYAFDPRRVAMLLIGGNKGGDDRFYETMIPRADRIYDAWLEELKAEQAKAKRGESRAPAKSEMRIKTPKKKRKGK
jgi:hypothetical protein